ncbi:AzlD domain-containing protein [Oculatella sp. LEGE 06141]|uniref:AzlD domain-containing protein n=1 Tax=Oculatella sp. LEGE 06141 TaxID=1828648 RepID=UPI0018813254|nr:AzlD domain-containing protein [Oculatella sp. LEGE 06141]MBE9178997.1 AzlD domain-containing protein [Oculatella sp. LEGE 06141]
MSSIGWVIFWGGIGTFLMRSAGVWIAPQYVNFRWLDYLPFAVILVMAVGSAFNLSDTGQQTLAAIAASSAVVVANFKELPLIVCIAIGCVVFGAITSL